jgi:hypothetical protein
MPKQHESKAMKPRRQPRLLAPPPKETPNDRRLRMAIAAMALTDTSQEDSPRLRDLHRGP